MSRAGPEEGVDRHALGIYVLHQLILFPLVAGVLTVLGYEVSLTEL